MAMRKSMWWIAAVVVLLLHTGYGNAYASEACTTDCGEITWMNSCCSRCDHPVESDSWDFKLKPFVWFAGMSSTVGVGDQQGGVDMNFGDILDDLSAAWMVQFEASNDEWVVFLDTEYISMNDQLDSRFPDIRTHVDQTIIELGARYKIKGPSGSFEPLAGIRYYKIGTHIYPASGGEGLTSNLDWTDPFVGAKFTAPTSERSFFSLRGDVGGFGVGSDFTWGGNAQFGWDLNDTTQLALGYRVLDIDYEEAGSSYENQLSGPFLAFSFDL
jgi:hypothetical protein